MGLGARVVSARRGPYFFAIAMGGHYDTNYPSACYHPHSSQVTVIVTITAMYNTCLHW